MLYKAIKSYVKFCLYSYGYLSRVERPPFPFLFAPLRTVSLHDYLARYTSIQVCTHQNIRVAVYLRLHRGLHRASLRILGDFYAVTSTSNITIKNFKGGHWPPPKSALDNVYDKEPSIIICVYGINEP